MIATPATDRTEQEYERWRHWPVNWTAVWVGSLAALALALIIGLFGIAIGANQAEMGERLFESGRPWPMIWCILGAFFSFVAGGWCTVKIAGILRSEPAILHAAIAWVVAVPFLVAFAALGAGAFFGSWNSGLAGNPAWATSASSKAPIPPPPSASQRDKEAFNIAERTYLDDQAKHARIARNTAVGAAISLLVSLIGAVIGGWLGCGEPMTFTYHRHRPVTTSTTTEAPVAPARPMSETFTRT
ncbi:MAG TPA: hypothetical protein VFA18_17135 [Gemmataceae bacterium]|nr:hypothetical protein [Gemmataceae bacterium]